MDKKKAMSTTTSAIRPLYARTMQNFLVAWLDQNIDEMGNVEYKTSLTKLQEVATTVHTFTNTDECIHFITNIKTEKVIIISSGTLGQTTVPIIHDMTQVNTIYIFCGDKPRHEEWVKQWPKIKGVFTDIKSVCEALGKAVKECDLNTILMSFVATSSDATNRSLDQLDQSFICTQILKEILLTINFEKKHMKEFITYYREQFADNKAELKNISKLERKYLQRTPIWWFTYPCFLYSMLNCALRTMAVDLIIKLGFFIRDLHEHITQLHAEQYAGHHHSNPFVVYHGQSLSQTDFDRLKETQSGLLSFNNFLSTSKNREVSLDSARKTMDSSDSVGILFVMTIDPSIPSVPFADIRNVSYHQEVEAVLFSMQSIFRIEQIKNIDGNKHLWQVNLSLTSENDPQLRVLTEHIREETYPHVKGWYRLGDLLTKLHQFEKAQQVFETILNQASNDHEKSSIYHMLGMVKDKQEKYAEAIIFYEKSIQINQKILPPMHSDLASSYSCLGQMYEAIGDHSKALQSLEKALVIQQKILPPNHPDVAASYSKMGNVFNKAGDYSRALSSYEKAHEIYRKTLPPNHPHLANSNNNIGLVYENKGEYSKALSFFQFAVDMGQHTLTEHDPKLQLWKNNVESVKKKL